MSEECEPIQELSEQIENWYTQWTLIDRLYIDYCQNLTISSSAISVLRFIYERPNGCTQRDICDFFYLPKQTVSSVLSHLEKENQIQKTPSTVDKRSVTIRLTPSGEKMVSEILSDLRKKEEDAFLSLNEQDRRELTRLNKILTDAMQRHITPYRSQ